MVNGNLHDNYLLIDWRVDESYIVRQRVTPCFPKYGVRVRDDGQQILTKRKISSLNILHYSKGAKFLHTYTKDNQEFYFHIKDIHLQ